MTEEQKTAEVERLQRLREKNRMDALMAKQRIQSYKVRGVCSWVIVVLFVLLFVCLFCVVVLWAEFVGPLPG